MYEAASSSKSAASAAYNKLIGLGKTTRFKSYYSNITRGKQAWSRDDCKSFEVNFLSSIISRHMDCMAKATDLRSPDLRSPDLRSPDLRNPEHAMANLCSSTQEQELAKAQIVKVQVGTAGAPIHVVKAGKVGFNMLCSMGKVEARYRGDCDWQLHNGVQLRPGLRGRHLFDLGTKSHFEGRCFEWRVVEAKSRVVKFGDASVVGPPLWQLYEIEFSDHGMVIQKPEVHEAASPTGV